MEPTRPCMCILAYGNLTLATLQSFLNDRSEDRKDMTWGLITHPGDAAVDRARCLVASDFYLRPEWNVLLFVDHDTEWQPTDANYLVHKANELKGVVGAVVSKRLRGSGWGCRLVDGIPHEIGSSELVELEEDSYVGMAMTAIHRDVLDKMVKAGIPKVTQGFWPFFKPTLKWNPRVCATEYLSEDWAFCHYARESGSKVYLAMKPITIHHGTCGYSAMDGISQVHHVPV